MTQAIDVIVIGASAGALDALSNVLSPLPADFPVPILIVVHLPADKKSVMASVLQPKCKIKVIEAEDKESLQAGTAYIAPPDYHLLAEEDKSISLSIEEPVLFSRPSIDVLFETAAESFGPSVIGIILTGANNDGAKGLRKIHDAGGKTIVQNPSQAYVGTMPECALHECPKAESMSLSEISSYLQKACSP